MEWFSSAVRFTKSVPSAMFPGDLMIVLTPDRRDNIESEEDLLAALEEHRDYGYAQFVLIGDDGAYLSAVGESFGPYSLEWFPAEPAGRHLKTSGELKIQEVTAAMLDFFHGGDGWRESLMWKDVQDEAQPLPARLLEALRKAVGHFRDRG
jgi:hypothetical protein